MHRDEAYRVVVVGERRRLGLARALLGAGDAIEQRAERRLFLGDAQELSDVRDALHAARQEEERLLDLELANGLAERARWTEALGGEPERAQHGANALERCAILLFDETAPLEHVPALEVGHQPAVRLGEPKERAIRERRERAAEHREERSAVLGSIEKAQEREEVLHLARGEESATGDDVRDPRARSANAAASSISFDCARIAKSRNASGSPSSPSSVNAALAMYDAASVASSMRVVSFGSPGGRSQTTRLPSG